jgi:hypothetical protein
VSLPGSDVETHASLVANSVQQVWCVLKMEPNFAKLCSDTMGETAEFLDEGLFRLDNETQLAISLRATAASKLGFARYLTKVSRPLDRRGPARPPRHNLPEAR